MASKVSREDRKLTRTRRQKQETGRREKREKTMNDKLGIKLLSLRAACPERERRERGNPGSTFLAFPAFRAFLAVKN